MKSRNILKTIFTVALTCAFSISLSSCFDLGEFGSGNFDDNNDYSSYYDAFGDVVGVYKAGQHEDQTGIRGEMTYSVENSLFNSYTVNSCSWEKEEYEVAALEYAYIAIPIRKSFVMGNLAIYLKASDMSNSNTKMDINFYLLDEGIDIPQNVCFLGCPSQIVVYDPDEHIVDLDYDDLDPTNAIAKLEFYPAENVWKSLLVSDWTKDGVSSPLLNVSENQTLVIQIPTNMGYGDPSNRCAFSFMNLLIKSVK